MITGLSWLIPVLLLSGQTPSSMVSDSVRRALAEYASRADALGVSGVVLIAEGDDILLHRAMGWRDAEHRIANDTTTLFYIASLLKQFVAAAVLKLQEEGRLHISDSIGVHLAGVPPDKRAVTIADLMYHRSGLGRYGFDAERRDWSVETREQALRGILGSPLSHPPGSRFDYQNSNYIVLTAIVEELAGTTMETFLKARFFDPLGMRDTYAGSRVTSALGRRVAWSLGDPAEAFTILDRPPSYLSMGRGVVTSARDLHRWMLALLSSRALTEASVRKLFTIGSELETGYGYGGGWYVRTNSTGARRIVFHRGDLRGYRSEVRLSLPSGRISIGLTNQSFRGQSLTETLLNDLGGIAFRGEANPLPAVAGDSSAVRAVTGEYEGLDKDRVEVVATGGHLELTPVGQRSVDWLIRSDTGGWRSRHRLMEASMAAIERLNQGGQPLAPDGMPLPPHQLKSFSAAWTQMSRHGGRLKSYQQLGVVHDVAAKADVALIRLNFVNDSLLFGVGWANDTLAFDAAGIGNLTAPAVFARLPDGRWASYDWTTGAVRFLRFDQSTLVLETLNGPIRWVRSSDPSNGRRW